MLINQRHKSSTGHRLLPSNARNVALALKQGRDADRHDRTENQVRGTSGKYMEESVMSKFVDKGAVAGRLIGSLAIWIVVGIFIWPGIMGVFNSVVFPGFETCKREIARYLQDSSSLEFEWPPRRFSRQADADIWGYAIVMYTTGATGAGIASMVECTVGGLE